MKLIKFATTILLMSSLSSVGAAFADEGSKPIYETYAEGLAEVSKKDVRELTSIPVETRTYFRPDCMVSDSKSGGSNAVLEAVLAVVVPKLIEHFIDSSAEQLVKVKKYESKSSFYDNLYTYKSGFDYPFWHPALQCMTVVTAKFRNTEDGKSGIRDQAFIGDEAISFSLPDDLPTNRREKKKALKDQSNSIDRAILDRLAANNIVLASVDSLYSIYEARFQFSEDHTAFRLESRLWKVTKLLSGRSVDAQIYDLKIIGPSSTPDGQVYTSVKMNLGKVTPPFWALGADIKKGKRSGLVSKPGMSKSSFLQFLKSRKVGGYTPVKFSVSSIQTKQPSDTAKFLASALTTLKPIVLSEVSNALKVEDEAATASAELSAKIALEKAKLANKNEADPDKKAITELELTQACNAYMQVGGKDCGL